MRALATKDVFGALRVVGKMDLFKLLEDAKMDITKDNAEEKAKELLLKMIANIADPLCEKEIYKFLAGPMEMKAEEVETLSLDKMMDSIVQIVEMSDMKSFFISAARLKGLLS